MGRSYKPYPHLTSEQQKLVEDNVNLVWHIYHTKYPSFDKDRNEDISQCGFVGLCKAAAAYDSSRGIRFSTLAAVVIINEMNMFIRKSKKFIPETSQEYVLAESCKSNDALTLADTFAIPTEDQPEVKAETHAEFDALTKAINKLPKAQKEIFTLMLSGLTETEIYKQGIGGRKLSRSYINRLKNKGLEMLRKTLPRKEVN